MYIYVRIHAESRSVLTDITSLLHHHHIRRMQYQGEQKLNRTQRCYVLIWLVLITMHNALQFTTPTFSLITTHLYFFSLKIDDIVYPSFLCLKNSFES